MTNLKKTKERVTPPKEKKKTIDLTSKNESKDFVKYAKKAADYIKKKNQYIDCLESIKEFLECNETEKNDQEYTKYKEELDNYINKIKSYVDELYTKNNSYKDKKAVEVRNLYIKLSEILTAPCKRGQCYARLATLYYEDSQFDEAYLWAKKYFADNEIINDTEEKYKERLNQYIIAINISKVEKKYLNNAPKDDTLKDELINAIKNSGIVDITGKSFKYFSRSMIQALISVIGEKKEEIKSLVKNDSKNSDETAENKSTKINFFKTITFKIGNIDCKYTTKAFINHFFNGMLENTGEYSDIKPFLTLITDSQEDKNSNLAKEFLSFRKAAFEFNEDALIRINNKFSIYDEENKKYYAKKLTLYAFLITYIEPIRYYLNCKVDNSLLTILPVDRIYASHIATTLKMIRDKKTTLKSLFDPNWIPTSGASVRSTNKKTRDTAIEHSYSFFAEKNNDAINKKEIRKHIFEYDSANEEETLSDYGSDSEDEKNYNWTKTIL